MKILYLNSTHMSSQLANLIQVKAMCKAFFDNGLDIILSVPGNSSDCVEKFSYSVDYRREILSNSKLDKYLSFFSIYKTIKNTNPDLIFLRDPLFLLFCVCFTNKKIIFESHNSILHEGIRVLNWFYRKLLKATISKNITIKLICISQALSNYWHSEGVSFGKIITAHDCVDLDMFLNMKTKINARRLLELPDNKVIITYSGRLYENRKIGNIIGLAQEFPDIYFLVVGGPNEQAEKFKNESKMLGIENIFFTGQVKHSVVPDYLAASDILLALWSSDVKTIKYCSPLKLFEYMAANRLILAHAFPTIKEVLTDGLNAILVEPDSLESLIEKVRFALSILGDSRIPGNAYGLVKEKYTWNKRVSSIIENIL